MERANAIISRFDPSKKIVGAEIGVYKGSLSRELLKGLPRLKLFMIDRWHIYTRKEVIKNGRTSMSRRKQETFEAAYERSKKIASYFPKRAKIIKLPSVEAAKVFKKRYFDFVFLDANHSFKAVFNDIRVWITRVKIGGYICGHDYHRKTVFKAVNLFFDNIEVGEDNTWFAKVS